MYCYFLLNGVSFYSNWFKLPKSAVHSENVFSCRLVCFSRNSIFGFPRTFSWENKEMYWYLTAMFIQYWKCDLIKLLVSIKFQGQFTLNNENIRFLHSNCVEYVLIVHEISGNYLQISDLFHTIWFLEQSLSNYFTMQWAGHNLLGYMYFFTFKMQ